MNVRLSQQLALLGQMIIGQEYPSPNKRMEVFWARQHALADLRDILQKGNMTERERMHRINAILAAKNVLTPENRAKVQYPLRA